MLKEFSNWANKEKISAQIIFETAIEVSNGLHDGDLGSGCYKKRIAAKGKGKRGGARTILSYKINDFIIFLYAYAKNKKANLTSKEQKALKFYSKNVLMRLTENDLLTLISNNEIIEVSYE